MSNCGKSFQEELTKSPFQSDFKSIITGVSMCVWHLDVLLFMF